MSHRHVHRSSLLRAPVTVVAVIALAVAACSASADDVSSSTYVGLDPTLVAEATANANFRSRLDEQPTETKAGLAQGMVINFAVCRQLLHAYEQLVTTGTSKPLPALPKPDHPESFSYDWWIKDHDEMSNAVRRRDVDVIRQWLTGEGSCGEWIPVTAKAPEMISDRVAELEPSS